MADGCLERVEDALILIEDGQTAAFGPHGDMAARLPAGVEVAGCENALILPGPIDAQLLDTARRGCDESAALIARWRGRQPYRVTPRFAPSW